MTMTSPTMAAVLMRRSVVTERVPFVTAEGAQ